MERESDKAVENNDKHAVKESIQFAAKDNVKCINEASDDTQDIEPEIIPYSCPEPRCGGSWCRPHSKCCKVGIKQHENSDRTCESCDFLATSKRALKKHKC